MRAAPRFIYFDMGNVLLHFSHERACRQMAEVAGISPERARRIVFESDLETRYERGAITSREFHETFCLRSETRPDCHALHAAASDMFEVNAPMIPVVAQLRAAGRRLGVLSNTCSTHWDHCRRRFSIIREPFCRLALSYELGAMKPEADIYHRAAELAGESPADIFFADDRPENVEAARAAGLDAVLYTDPLSLVAELRGRGVRFNY
jgi:HAD superfamily hydrolase (TIGR01509 family)